ncbi:unnamed protein product [Mytilus edulis]|uniref:Uncharacterized protein n=1 Tax=Mytilus edulis TaxID=6550 RepID=A0A8S3TGR0_MYTED|nr:unnamed protein product [Mytilus edulis]
MQINVGNKPDQRLNRQLTIQELIKAFGKLKRLMTSAFPVSVTGLPTLECRNNLSARSQPDVVNELLRKECENGFMYGPFDTLPFSSYHVSPLGVVVGKYSKKKRLLIDLSAPHQIDIHFSMNELIAKDTCSMSTDISNYDMELFSDALSTIGFGGYFGGKWFYSLLPTEIKNITNSKHSMAFFEFFSIVVAAVLWGASWKTKKVVF